MFEEFLIGNRKNQPIAVVPTHAPHVLQGVIGQGVAW